MMIAVNFIFVIIKIERMIARTGVSGNKGHLNSGVISFLFLRRPNTQIQFTIHVHEFKKATICIMKATRPVDARIVIPTVVTQSAT